MVPNQSAAGLDRTFEALVFDWDGTAVPDRRASAAKVRRRMQALSAAGVEVAVVSGTHLENIDGQLRARPAGPGRLLLALNRGSELFEVLASGPRLVWRRSATAAEDRALDVAAAMVVDKLGRQGLAARIVSSRLNRRRIDLIPEPEWADPPQARIGELLDAVTARLHSHDIGELSDVVRLAVAAASEAGLAGGRVTSDVKHVEVGLTDKSDSMRTILADLAERGIGPGLVLVVGDEFGPLGGVPGSDSLLMVPEADRAMVVSVGTEPTGTPAGVVHRPGGPEAFLDLLDEQLRRRRRRRVPGVDLDPAWTITYVGPDPVRRRVTESLFTVGDGGLATRGSVEETLSGSVPLMLAAGLYDGIGPAQHLAVGPGWTGLTIDPAPSVDRRILDLRCGLLLREETGQPVPVRTLRLAPAERAGLMAMRAEAATGRLRPGPPLQRDSGGDMLSGALDGYHWARVQADRTGGIAAVARDYGSRVDGRRTIERLAAYALNRRRRPALDGAVAALRDADEQGFDRLLAEHRSAWAKRWADVGVTVPDDPAAQLAVRYALFQLWCNVGGGPETAVGARGLSGPGYAGHVFWDADVFVLPAIASMDPVRARAMLEYRVRRLATAQTRAREDGREGARFPWESARDGDDVTPRQGDLAGTAVPILTGQLEEHITADVAWAANHYAQWVGDRAFLSGPGAGLLVETARYWASRCRVANDGSVHIDRVIGPDEYHEAVDDNAFTNVMAGWNLRRGAGIVEAVDGPGPQTGRWRDLADRLVTGYDQRTRVYEQFSGYFALEPLLIGEIATPPIAADVLLGRERVAQSQTIKQPDVLMLHHLLPADVAPGSLAPNVEFYGPRTSHGSSLSPAIMASVLARAGRADDALDLLRTALQLDLDDLTGMTAAGLHLATLGGVWQAMMMGFGGVRVCADTLHLDPRLPSQWGSLQLRFRCLRRRIVLDIGTDAVEVHTDGPVKVQLAGCPRRNITESGRLSLSPT